MRRLRPANGEIPRTFQDSRRSLARKSRAYCVAIQQQWGPLPAVALPTLREAARAAIELERLAGDLEAARGRRQLKQAARIRKATFMLREQLGRLEARLEALGRAQPNRTDRVRQFLAGSAAVTPRKGV
jgi:hypothetical protein